MDRERSAIEAAVAYLRETIEAGATDVRTQSVYEGLLDVLDPTRYATRIEQAVSADAVAAVMRTVRERRSKIDRRGHSDRRLINLGPPATGERRSGADRRAATDRRRSK
jgi:hypothetical protein